MRTDVVFLSAPDAIRLYYGSTFLRGMQLTELLATRLSDYSFTFTTDGQLTDSVVILLDRPAATELRGVFHITGGGDTNWAEFAAAILAASAALGGPSARVMPIATSENPAAARRPANSRLDNSRLASIHGVRLPHWQHALQGCIERLVRGTGPSAP